MSKASDLYELSKDDRRMRMVTGSEIREALSEKDARIIELRTQLAEAIKITRAVYMGISVSQLREQLPCVEAAWKHGQDNYPRPPEQEDET